jgi:hypothetical protein
MKGKMPRDGQTVSTSMWVARVVGSNPLKETVIVELESQVTVELPIGEVKVISRPPMNNPEPINKEIKEPQENERIPDDNVKS